jgi:hypothetical protein
MCLNVGFFFPKKAVQAVGEEVEGVCEFARCRRDFNSCLCTIRNALSRRLRGHFRSRGAVMCFLRVPGQSHVLICHIGCSTSGPRSRINPMRHQTGDSPLHSFFSGMYVCSFNILRSFLQFFFLLFRVWVIPRSLKHTYNPKTQSGL